MYIGRSLTYNKGRVRKSINTGVISDILSIRLVSFAQVSSLVPAWLSTAPPGINSSWKITKLGRLRVGYPLKVVNPLGTPEWHFNQGLVTHSWLFSSWKITKLGHLRVGHPLEAVNPLGPSQWHFTRSWLTTPGVFPLG